MNKEDYAIVSNPDSFELRFKTLELWGELKTMLDN